MTDAKVSKTASRGPLRTGLIAVTMLVVTAAIGIFLYLQVNTLLNQYMEVQGEKQAETLAELTHRQFQVELTALYTVASELPQIEGMREKALRAIQEADNSGQISVQYVDGTSLYGNAYSSVDFPCIDSAVHGENAISYCPGKGLMFCVPAFRDKNIAYVVCRLYSEDVLRDRFGVDGYSGSGHTRIEDFERGIVVDSSASDQVGTVFDEPSVRDGIDALDQNLYDKGSASDFRTSSIGDIMLYAALIEGTDYHVVGYVPKSVVMQGVQGISYLVIIVFTVLAAMMFAGGFLLVVLERKSRESNALREAARVAEKANAAKSEFLANMSHDIRTPMNAITGFTRLALQDPTDAQNVKDCLEKIQSASDNLLSQLNGILEMSRIESGNLDLVEEPCFLPDILDELRVVTDDAAQSKQLTVTMQLDEVTNRTVWCDRARLRQMLLNLLSNAIKFTPEGGNIWLGIRQSTADSPEKARYIMVVKDDGIGMSQEFAEKAFTPFERERTSTVSGLEGSGLGLAIVKNFVDAMGGTIQLKTDQGSGTQVTVELEMRFADDPLPQQAQQDDTAELSLDGLRVLLVDDIELNREIAAAVLEMSDFEVEQACDGTEAVDMVATAEPGYYDLVLMDIQMPTMNGYEATQAIRKLEGARSRVPIIALSANAFDEDRKASADAGMNAHLAKPLDPDELMDTLRQLLG